jgi:hypothetical protein
VAHNRHFILKMYTCVCHGSLLLVNHEHKVTIVAVYGRKVNVLLWLGDLESKLDDVGSCDNINEKQQETIQFILVFN